MTKFLSSDGLKYFYNQIKSKFAAAIHNHSAGDITSGTLPIARGGTGLTATPSMLTNLGSTSAANVLQASPRPGVAGTLPVANGGTGATTVTAAVKALLGTSALGSSTKPIYYDGAALKACADSIGGGGIVAQLLAENGYVKFANGLILQWGFNNASPITFPISFSKQVLNVIPQLQAPNDNSNMSKNRVAVINLTTSTFELQNSQDSYNWIALGI